MSTPFAEGSKSPVCVFCGSSPGSSALYGSAADSVGKALATAGIPLVYGGGRRGLMGVVSKAALTAGGYAHGITPRALIKRASEHTPEPSTLTTVSASELPPKIEFGSAIQSKEGVGAILLEDDDTGRLSMEVVGSMHERKTRMAELSKGGFVVLPGGYGTFEEMMEMVTWNQLGIHMLPVVILNIGNLYTPLKALLQNAVQAGFINPDNLSLLRIVDLPGGSSANLDIEKADEWGKATLQALNDWSISGRAGYNIDWSTNGDSATPSQPSFSLFTTTRFTSPVIRKTPVTRDEVPLIDLHLKRLREAHEWSSSQAGGSIWGKWPGDEIVEKVLLDGITETTERETGDWRVRLLLHVGPKLEVQMIPVSGMDPFEFSLPAMGSKRPRRPLLLDPEVYRPTAHQENPFRLYKTTERTHYDDAAARADHILPKDDHPEILLHTSTHLLETATSNIAILMPTANGSKWITPTRDRKERPFLAGVMRRYLLEMGEIEEGDPTVEDWQRAKSEGWTVVGFNGLRGVWEAELR